MSLVKDKQTKDKNTIDELNDLVFQGVIWPDAKKIGGETLQVFFNCDPAVCNLFENRFLTKVPPGQETPLLVPMKRSEWIDLAKMWAREVRPQNEIDINLH